MKFSPKSQQKLWQKNKYDKSLKKSRLNNNI